MNQEEKEIIKESQARFKSHKWLHVTVRDDADSLPYKISPFTAIIEHSKDDLQHKNYILHINDKYLTVSSKEFKFEPVKLLIDDRIWIELFYIFDVNVKKSKKDKSLLKDRDEEHI